jgi:hypothetical protein
MADKITYIHPYSMESKSQKCAFCYGAREGKAIIARPSEAGKGWYCCETEDCKNRQAFCSAEFMRRIAGPTSSFTEISSFAEKFDSITKSAIMADYALAKAFAMPGDPDKNLFQILHGAKHDSKCPHGLPLYACMPCSH